MYAIIGTDQSGNQVFWRKWTGDCIKGRPKWVNKLSLKCLYENKATAQKTVNGTGSTHWNITGITNISIMQVTQLP